MAAPHADQQGMYFCQQAGRAPASQASAQGRPAGLIHPLA
jgi:hypothetical protein